MDCRTQQSLDLSDAELNALNGSVPPSNQSLEKIVSNRRKLKRKFFRFSSLNEERTLGQQATPRATPTSFANSITWLSAMNPIRNQLSCSDCWAFSALGALEGMYNVKHPNAPVGYLSTRELVSCYNTASPCGAGYAGSALTWIATNGIVADSLFPYTGVFRSCTNLTPTMITSVSLPSANTCSPGTISYYSIVTVNGVSTKTLVKTVSTTCTDTQLYALLQNGPVSVPIDGNVIQTFTGGIFDSPCVTSNHAVVVIGYGIDAPTGYQYWIVRNSWAAIW